MAQEQHIERDVIGRGALIQLDHQERKLLLALDGMTPPKHRRQERDAVRGEDVVQEAGLGFVGAPDTKMAIAMRSFAVLARNGWVERVKGEEGDGGIKYRITQLAERVLLSAKLATAEAEVVAVEQKLRSGEHERRIAVGNARVWKGEAEASRDVMRDIVKTRWWQFGQRKLFAQMHLDELEAGQVFVSDDED